MFSIGILIIIPSNRKSRHFNGDLYVRRNSDNINFYICIIDAYVFPFTHPSFSVVSFASPYRLIIKRNYSHVYALIVNHDYILQNVYRNLLRGRLDRFSLSLMFLGVLFLRDGARDRWENTKPKKQNEFYRYRVWCVERGVFFETDSFIFSLSLFYISNRG